MLTRSMLGRAVVKVLMAAPVLLLTIISQPNAFSADAGKILFHSYDEEGPPWICSINADNTGFKKIIKNGLWPVWSPDKKMFAYFALPDQRGNSESASWGVSISDFNGKILYIINPLKPKIIENNLPSYCEWSPDGNNLAIITAAPSRAYVRVFNLATNRVHDVYADPVSDFDITFIGSSVEWLDNTRLLFINGSPEKDDEATHIVDLEKNIVITWKKSGIFLNYSIVKGILGIVHTEKETIFNLYDDEGNLKKKIGSLDGKYLPMSRLSGHNLLLLSILPQSTFDNPLYKLYCLNLSTMKMDEINIPSGRHRLFDPVFSPEGDKIVYALIKDEKNEEYPKAYYTYDFATKKTALLKKFKKASGYGLSTMLMFIGKQSEFSWK